MLRYFYCHLLTHSTHTVSPRISSTSLPLGRTKKYGWVRTASRAIRTHVLGLPSIRGTSRVYNLGLCSGTPSKLQMTLKNASLASSPHPPCIFGLVFRHSHHSGIRAYRQSQTMSCCESPGFDPPDHCQRLLYVLSSHFQSSGSSRYMERPLAPR